MHSLSSTKTTYMYTEDFSKQQFLDLTTCQLTLTCMQICVVQRLIQSTQMLLFPVDRDTRKFFCRLQSNVFDAASLIQTNHVVH